MSLFKKNRLQKNMKFNDLSMKIKMNLNSNLHACISYLDIGFVHQKFIYIRLLTTPNIRERFNSYNQIEYDICITMPLIGS